MLAMPSLKRKAPVVQQYNTIQYNTNANTTQYNIMLMTMVMVMNVVMVVVMMVMLVLVLVVVVLMAMAMVMMGGHLPSLYIKTPDRPPQRLLLVLSLISPLVLYT